MWNEQHWTLVSMPVTSTRAQWDEGLRTVRQFNDLLRVLPPVPQTGVDTPAIQSAPRRSAPPSRPHGPAPMRQSELPPGRADAAPGAEVGRYPTPPRNGRQSAHYQR
jgi:hypothetical protein